jgi:TolA-binding protein
VSLLAAVACVAVIALVATKGRAPSYRAARRVDDRVAKNDGRAVRDSADAQLTRLEQAIDAIAIEVERVAENQRFLTKRLASEPTENTRSAQDRRDV